MTDPRITPNPEKIHDKKTRQVVASSTDLFRTPRGPRDRQLHFGTQVTQFSQANGLAYVQSDRDGYVGYVTENALGNARPSTHRISALGSTLYNAADFKSADIQDLFHGSTIQVIGTEGNFVKTPDGFVPKQHVSAIDEFDTDPASVAALYLGVPYLWGGNSPRGIDCSGLTQAALLACGIPCPADSDMQESLGIPATESYQRNDLLFWKGHVALVSDPETLIHANAGAMATVYEPIADAISRISDQGDGPVTAHRRLPALSD